MHPSSPRWLVALATLLALIVPLGPLGAADFAGDTTAPVLVGFTATPASADVSTAPATFSVALHVTDDLSGVDFQPMGYTLDGSGNVVRRRPSPHVGY